MCAVCLSFDRCLQIGRLTTLSITKDLFVHSFSVTDVFIPSVECVDDWFASTSQAHGASLLFQGLVIGKVH